MYWIEPCIIRLAYIFFLLSIIIFLSLVFHFSFPHHMSPYVLIKGFGGETESMFLMSINRITFFFLFELKVYLIHETSDPFTIHWNIPLSINHFKMNGHECNYSSKNTQLAFTALPLPNKLFLIDTGFTEVFILYLSGYYNIFQPVRYTRSSQNSQLLAKLVYNYGTWMSQHPRRLETKHLPFN